MTAKLTKVKEPGNKRLFHYTVGACLPQIIRSGEIKLATAFVNKGEKPAVWFSTNPVWEQTANKMLFDKDTGRLINLDKEGTALWGNGLVRIEIVPEAAPYTWWNYKRLSRAKKKILRGLYEVAMKDGADPKEWRVSFEPVRAEFWLAIEIWSAEKKEWERIWPGDAKENENSDLTDGLEIKRPEYIKTHFYNLTESFHEGGN